MNPERWGATICLTIVFAIFTARVLVALVFPRSRNPRGRVSLLAILTGVVAFLATGAFIPLDDLDSFLGNANYINLVQNSSALFAFWLHREACMSDLSGAIRWVRLWIPLAMIAIFSFFFIIIPDRGGTSFDFINQYADQWTLWAYATTYMTCVLAFVVATSSELRGRRARPYVAIRVGCGLVAGGCIVENVYLTLRLFGNRSEGMVELVRLSFAPLFYGGVAAIAVGLVSFWITKIARTSALSCVELLLRASTVLRDGGNVQERTGSPALDAYRLAVRFVDVTNNRPLGFWERLVLKVSNNVLDVQTKAPPVTRMSIKPVEWLT